MPALDNNVRKLLGANAVTRPVDELTDTALIHFVWNFGEAQLDRLPEIGNPQFEMVAGRFYESADYSGGKKHEKQRAKDHSNVCGVVPDNFVAAIGEANKGHC